MSRDSDGLDGVRVSPDRRTEIRDKARHIFMRHGYRKTTLEDIGKACGIGKAALYRYFASKEDLFATVVRAESATMLSQIRAAVRKADSPRAMLAAMLRARFKFIGDMFGELAGTAVGAELEELLPMAAGVRQEFFRQEAQIIVEILEEGHRQGLFRKLDKTSLPHIIIAGLRGIELHFAENQDAPTLEEGMDAMLELIFDGICQ